MNEDVIKFLNGISGAVDAVAISTYGVYIKNREVTVKVIDAGPGTGDMRFSVEAYYSDIPESERGGGTRGWSLGNSEPTLNAALHNVHWWEFDGDD